MVNHIFTWLMNVAPASGALANEIFIEPGFDPVPITNMGLSLIRARNILFNNFLSREDRFQLGFRYLAIIRMSELLSSLEEFDPRVTDNVHELPLSLSTSGEIGMDTAQLLDDLSWVSSSFFSDTGRKNIWNDTREKTYNRLAAVIVEVSRQTEKASRSLLS